MKSLLQFILLMIVSTIVIYAQTNDITSIPFQSNTSLYAESAPVVINDNELLIFYVTNYKNQYGSNSYDLEDTIYTLRSTDGGKTFETPVFFKSIPLNFNNHSMPYFLTALKHSSGRILVCWADAGKGKILLFHSDDNGLTWSDTTFIEGGGINSFLRKKSIFYITMSELNNGSIILSSTYYSVLSSVYYRVSTDTGESWPENELIFYDGNDLVRDVNFVKDNDNNLNAYFYFKNYISQGIYKQVSTDGGISWSEMIPVIESAATLSRPRVVKLPDNQLWLTYQYADTLAHSDNQNDIYYIKSNNNGNTWDEPVRFTRYVGEDKFINVINLNDKPFITFTTTRFGNKEKIAFAGLTTTEEKYLPPYIYNIETTVDSSAKKTWSIRCKIIDDKEVVSASVSDDKGNKFTLYDDGNHNDVEAGDFIYGTTYVINYYNPVSADVMDVNNITLPIDNHGNIAGVFNITYQVNMKIYVEDSDNFSTALNDVFNFSYNPSAVYDDITFLFSSGFFLSGYDNQNLWGNGVARSNLIGDYIPGEVGSNRWDPKNKIYIVNRSDPPFSDTWQQWKDAVALGAEFYDGDNDGIYNPMDKNWNGSWEPNEDMPMILGDRTMWCVYNDGLPGNQRWFNEVEPLGIEIKQTLFATSIDHLNDVIFLKYSITNTGTVTDVLDSVIFGFWQDPDIGNYTNDLIGSDTLLNSAFTYSDTTEEDYGINPPSFFITLLQGPVVTTNNPADTAFIMNGEQFGTKVITGAKNLNISSFTDLSIPFNEGFWSIDELRYSMLGRGKVGNIIDPCTFIRGEVKGGVDCNEVNPFYWYSGDPVSGYGWINVTPADVRSILNVGPFRLEKGKPQELIAAYVVRRGTDYLNSITIARENVMRAIQEYKSNFATMTYTAPPPTNPIINYVLYQNYPNPFNPATTIRYELPQDGIVTIKVYDILGQEVATILNEFRKAGRYEIKFNAKGLASGVYIYKMNVNDFIESKKMILLR